MASIETTTPEPSEPIEAAPSRRARLWKALKWTTVGHALSQLVRLGSSVILTRLLVPEVYGVMELVWVFITGLRMLSDVGIETCIVHSKRGDDERFLNTAWTLQVIRGALLFTLALIGAYPMALLFRQPDLAYLIPAVGVTALIGGFNATSIQTEERRINVGAVIRLGLVIQLASVVLQVSVALVWPSIWVLVLGSWLACLIELTGSFYFLRSIRHRFEWDREALSEIYRYGRWVLGSTAVHFFATNGDRLILARLLDDIAQLGVYAIALRLQGAVQALHTRLVGAIVFPALAEKNREFATDDPARIPSLSAMYYKSRLGLDAVFVTGAGVLLAWAPLIVSVLYDEQYQGAAWILQILTIQLAAATIVGPPEALLSAIGMTKYGFFRSISRATWTAIALPAGWWLGGFEGLVWAVALTELAAIAAIWPAMIRHGFFHLRGEIRAAAFFGTGWLIGHSMLSGLQSLFPSLV